jgi:hypothetical protein
MNGEYNSSIPSFKYKRSCEWNFELILSLSWFHISIGVIHKVTLSSLCLWACFHPSPLFQQYPQSKENLLNLSMKCWNSAFNAQGSRVIIVTVQVRAVKIYVAAVKAIKEKERQYETQIITKIAGKTSLGPVILLCKIFIRSYLFDALLCRN